MKGTKKPHRPLVPKMILPRQRIRALKMPYSSLEHGHGCWKPFGNKKLAAQLLRYSEDGLVV